MALMMFKTVKCLVLKFILKMLIAGFLLTRNRFSFVEGRGEGVSSASLLILLNYKDKNYISKLIPYAFILVHL